MRRRSLNLARTSARLVSAQRFEADTRNPSRLDWV